MTVKSLLLILMGGVLVNNYALHQFLGVTPFLGYSRKENKILGMGLAVTLMIVLTTAVIWPVHTYVLSPYGLEYLQILLCVLVIAALAYGINALLGKKLGIYTPVIALNSAVLGAALNQIGAGYNYLEALVASLGIGAGFLFAMLVMAGLMSRINEYAVPKAFRGLPIMLITASIVSLALLAFR